ncbi:MAG: TPM domain-containing protein [Massilia sp.]
MTTTALLPRLLQFFLLALLYTFASHSIAKDQFPVFESYVTDNAGVLGTRAAVIDYKLRAHEAATGQQVFVLTVPTTGGRSIEEYAVGVFQQWKIGRKGIDDGVLLVVAVDDRKTRIEVGYGLEGWLTDARCSRIIHDLLAPQFARGQYAVGTESGVDAVLRTLAAPRLDTTPPVEPIPWSDRIHNYMGLAIAGVMALVLGLISLCFGVYGLLFISLPALILPAIFLPGWPGHLVSAVIISAWLYGRRALIAPDLRKHHFKPSRSPLVTSLRVFFLSDGGGRPIRMRKSRGVKTTSSFVWSDSSDSSSSSSSDSDCGGSGGRSGGAGASGGW